MTCFWDAIVSSLNQDDFKLFGEKNFTINRESVITFLKSKNKNCSDVLWQQHKLKQQELDEHIEAVKCYNIKGIGGGHLTSTCDSFLLLICQLFNININHKYCKTMITYEKSENVRRSINFKSNGRHFSR
mgnify:CR=1 FL=1